MISKPSVNNLDWVPSGDVTRIVEPTVGKKNIGWSPLEPYPAQNANWINYSNDQWIKYLDRLGDVLSNNVVAILGSASQVTDELATHSTPQAAYDAAHAAGGGIVKVLAGTHTGNLDMDQDSGVIFQGVGLQSIIDGNVLLSGDNNAFKAIDITGTISITGNDSFAACWLSGIKYLFPVGMSQGIQVEVLSNITLDESYNGSTLFVDTTGGAIDIQLPAPIKEFKFTLKDVGNNLVSDAVTLVRDGTEEIEFNGSNFEIRQNGASISFYCDGTNWFIISGTGSGGGIAHNGTKTIDDDYTVLFEDNGKVINVDTTTKAIEVTLPDPDTLPENFTVTIKDYLGNSSNNSIETILADDTNEMDGEVDGADEIDEAYKAVTFVKSNNGYTRLTYLASNPFTIQATGGTITESGGFKIHTFNSSANFTITNGAADVEYLVVAGGGAGGGHNGGGGGGAGGFRTGTILGLGVGSYTVTVGAGGSGVSGATGGSGANSVFNTITSTGGGGGGRGQGPNAESGLSGGSGGGAGGETSTQSLSGGSGTGGQGNAGGNNNLSLANYGAGGGGGANTAGVTGGVNSGAGGSGLSSSISGSSVTYAGGGGGGQTGSGATRGLGGLGGGGDGVSGVGNGNPGSANTGGGGGGGNGSTALGGNGGSGIVIVRYAI